MTDMQPGEQLLLLLEKLRIRLSNSGVERTQGLRDNMGRDCPYYRKSMQLFLERDYEDVKNLTKQINTVLSIIEGEK